MIATIQLEKIRIDGGTQPRVEIDTETVSDYAEQMTGHSDDFPPVDLFHDGVDHWLADGFHRYHAAVKRCFKIISCNVHKGTVRDAILFAVGANGRHGLRRTNADKRKAIETLLRDEEWSKNSSRWIAERCGVTNKTVDQVRKELGNLLSCDGARTVKDGKVRRLPTPKSDSAPADSAPKCPNCGSTERDADGDCSKCFEPAPEQARPAVCEPPAEPRWQLSPAMVEIKSKVAELAAGCPEDELADFAKMLRDFADGIESGNWT